MKLLDNETLVRQMKWRYAVKKFDPARKISPEDWKALEETLVLTPSSYGLQPWKFVIVSNPAIREQLVAATWNQRQVADASHLVVFAIRKNLCAADVDRYLDRLVEVRGTPRAAMEGYRTMMVAHVSNEDFDIDGWAARQTYIALGSFMTAAALLGIDTCPMEGLVPEKYDEILGLSEKGYATICSCPAGYRSPDCKYAEMPKVRFKHEEVIEYVK